MYLQEPLCTGYHQIVVSCRQTQPIEIASFLDLQGMCDQNLLVIYLENIDETSSLTDHKLRIVDENHGNNVVFLRLNHPLQL